MGRVDPREPRAEEPPVVRRPIPLEIDVREDEARQDEEDVHPKTRAIQQARAVRRERPVKLEVEQHDAERQKEPHAGERIERVRKGNPRGAGSVSHVAPPDDRAPPGRSLVSTQATARPLARGSEVRRVWEMGCDAGAQ